MTTTEKPNCDFIELVIASHHGDLLGGDMYLQFTQNGKVVATAPITNRDVKKIKSGMAFFKKAKAGAAQSIHEQHR